MPKKTLKKKANKKSPAVKSGGTSAIIKKYNADPTRLMDILLEVQASQGCVSDAAIKEISKSTGLPIADVNQTVTFYQFFSKKPRGKFTIYLNNSVVSTFKGFDEVKDTFEKATGIKFGNVTKDGQIGLFLTADIGMNDQEPAAIINNQVFTNLTPEKARAIIAGIYEGKTIDQLKGTKYGDGKNSHPLLKSMVQNNIMKKGEVVFSDYAPGETIKKIANMSSTDVINIVKSSGLRGRGGAGFPTGMKWEFCRKNQAEKHYLLCNADEGEPGTFKDRVILTEIPMLVFEGMTAAGYAIGADLGILYLRNEYLYMKDYLNSVLDDMRSKGLLGISIAGRKGFNYDIRIQFGAGAYVCGEESALIESAEGKRGEPRDRPPFPVENGYLGMPTSVNNVETLATAAKIIVKGAEWFSAMGTKDSKGTKVLCVSGDCANPGLYEVVFGTKISDVLKMAGAEDIQAVQVGGPSGTCIALESFDRTIAFEDMATGGALIIIGKDRALLKEVVLNYLDFFIEESCGSCVPCRAMTVNYKKTLEKLLHGYATKADIDAMLSWESMMKKNRCGLGQTAMNPVVTTIKNFRNLYNGLIKITDDSIKPSFDEKAATKDYEEAVK